MEAETKMAMAAVMASIGADEENPPKEGTPGALFFSIYESQSFHGWDTSDVDSVQILATLPAKRTEEVLGCSDSGRVNAGLIFSRDSRIRGDCWYSFGEGASFSSLISTMSGRRAIATLLHDFGSRGTGMDSNG